MLMKEGSANSMETSEAPMVHSYSPKTRGGCQREKSINMAEAIPFDRELFLRVELAMNSLQVTSLTVGNGTLKWDMGDTLQHSL